MDQGLAEQYINDLRKRLDIETKEKEMYRDLYLLSIKKVTSKEEELAILDPETLHPIEPMKVPWREKRVALERAIAAKVPQTKKEDSNAPVANETLGT